MSSQSDKHVVVFSNTFWSLWNFRQSLIRNLHQQGFKVVAVSADDPYRQKVADLGCETIVLKNLDAKSTSLLKEVQLIWEIRQALQSITFEYIYTYTIKPNVYTALNSLFSSKKIILTVNGLGNVFSGNSIVRTISLNLFRLAFRQAYRIVFQNRDDYTFFHKEIGLSPRKVLFVRGSGVNTEMFSYSQRPAQPGSKLVFLMACRLLKEKGVFEYIEAARRIKALYPEVQFWLIGMKANNQSAINIDALRSFEGEGIIQLKPQTDNMSDLLEKVDVLVLPSYYNEGVPRVLLEGLAKGLPIITTNSVGCKETVVHEQNGYLIEPKNIEALEAALYKTISLSPEERAQMRRESRHLAETVFDETKVIQTYINILHDTELSVAYERA